MPRINLDDTEKYQNGGKGGFFALGDDGDKAIVRFYHKDLKDIDVIPVHKVDVNGRNRSVECVREPDEPKSKCPFCDSGLGVSVRLFLRVLEYSKDKDGYYTLNPECKVWERGAGMKKQLQSLVNRYGKNGFYNKVFEIERCGKKGDQKTTYQIYPVDDLEDDECPIPNDEDMNFADILGGIVISRSVEDMEYYLDNEEFPKEEEEKPKRNREAREERNERTRSRDNRRDEEEEEDNPPFDTEEEEMPQGRRRRSVSEQSQSDDDSPVPPRRRSRV